MTAWITYALAVSILLTVAALAAEWAVRAVAGPARWVWGVAMTASAAVPIYLGLAAGPFGGGGPVAGGAAAATAPLSAPGGTASAADPWWVPVQGAIPFLESWMAPLWIGASAGLLLILAGGVMALGRRARAWPRVDLPRGSALLSSEFGPAVIAGLRSRVVIPRWALHLGPRPVEIIMTHEEEHRRAGDVPLLLTGAALVALLPWNPLLWFQLHRLRAAVELDCDHRVLARGVQPVPYAELLLELGARPRGRVIPWAALAAHPSLLERRLTMIVRGTKRVSRGAALGAGVVAAALVFLACETDAPPLAPEDAPERAGAVAEFQAQENTIHAVQTGAPLFVVDGVLVDRSFVDELPRESIDRIEVIKGGAAEAFFGPRAAAGVVQIYTRSPDAPVEARAAGAAAAAGAILRLREKQDGGTAEFRLDPPPAPSGGVLRKRDPN